MPSTFDLRGLQHYTKQEAIKFAQRGGVAAAKELQVVLGPDGGPRTGRVYKRGKKNHQASAPGESPAIDSGRMRQSSMPHPVRIEGDKVIGAAGVATPYALALELGTEKMEPRPSVSRLSERERSDRIFTYAAKGLGS